MNPGVEAQGSRLGPDGSPYMTRRGVLRTTVVLAAAALLTEGCSVLDRDPKKLPGEIIEGGRILGTTEELMQLFHQRERNNQPIVINPDTGKFNPEDADAITFIKSAAYLTMRQRGLSEDIARQRADNIRLADRRDIFSADAITAPSSGPENIGIILAREFLDPRVANSSLINLSVISHEASHASPLQHTDAGAQQDFGVLGGFEQKGPRFGFEGVEEKEYPNDILRKLIEFPETPAVTRADEFAAETGRIDFMLGLTRLPEDIRLNLTPNEIYYSVGFGNLFGNAPEDLRAPNRGPRLNTDFFTPEQINAYHQKNDRAGFFLRLGDEILANNQAQQTAQTVLSEGNRRAVGLLAFTGFVMPSNDSLERAQRINRSLRVFTDEVITPDVISEQAQILASF